MPIGPIDYSVETANPFDSFLRGYSGGAAIRTDMQAQAEAERQRQLQEQQRQQQAAMLDELARNPSADNYARAMLVMPGAKDQLKAAWDLRSGDQRQGDLRTAGQVYSALRSGNKEVAKQLLDEQATALENSGGDQRQMQAMRTLSNLVDQSPDLAQGMALAILQTAEGGDKILSAITGANADARAQELQPGLVEKGKADAAKAAADASTAQTTAKFAESKAVMDLRMSQEQIKKWAADTDIARMNARIAAMNAATSRADTDLKRQELALKVQDAIRERDDKLRGKVADVEAARGNVDNMLNTIDRVLKNPSLNDVLGSFEGRMPAMASALDDEESDAIALIETLGSQAFLAQIPNIKGMGALSNAEGEKLQSALQNLTRAQSEKQFKASAKEAQRLMLIARKNIAARYGVPENVPDTPAAEPSPNEVDALLKKYGGGG
jgi:hypothetical protein